MAHVPGFLDAPAGHGAAGAFTPPGHSDDHPGLALGLTEVVQFSTPGRAAVLDLILPLPAANAANSDVIVIVFPGQGGSSSGSDSGDDGSSAGGSAAGGSSSAGGSIATAGTGGDRSLTPISLVRAVSGTPFTTNNPVATSIAAATGSALAILLPPNAGTATVAATGTTLVALPPGIGTNAAGTADTVSSATPFNGASAAVAPSTLPFGFAPPSFPAIEGPHGPVTVAVAPLPHVPVPVEPVTPAEPTPTAEPPATTPVATAEATASATTTATSADQSATATPEEEATTSRWTWFGAAALAVGGLYWAARQYVRARRGNLFFRRRLAALPLGTILSTDLERL
jgi:hypothetical protein